MESMGGVADMGLEPRKGPEARLDTERVVSLRELALGALEGEVVGGIARADHEAVVPELLALGEESLEGVSGGVKVFGLFLAIVQGIATVEQGPATFVFIGGSTLGKRGGAREGEDEKDYFHMPQF